MNICACMGPQNGEPLCPCRMISAGLKTEDDYKLSPEELEKFNKALAGIFGWDPAQKDN